MTWRGDSSLRTIKSLNRDVYQDWKMWWNLLRRKQQKGLTLSLEIRLAERFQLALFQLHHTLTSQRRSRRLLFQPLTSLPHLSALRRLLSTGTQDVLKVTSSISVHGLEACLFQSALMFVKKKELCLSCFMQGHNSVECTRTSVCRVPGCGQKHNSCLHSAIITNNNNDNNQKNDTDATCWEWANNWSAARGPGKCHTEVS